jgi:sugar (pentulose or hexulose) kinase
MLAGTQTVTANTKRDRTSSAAAAQAVSTSLAAALEHVDRADVAAIAVSGQQHGLVALDAERAPVAPAKLWCDTEAAPQAAALSQQLPWRIPSAFTAAKLRWLQEERPEEYARVRHVLLPHDYVNFWLTGELAMEVRRAGVLCANAKVHAPEVRAWPMGVRRAGMTCARLVRLASL